MRFTRIHHILIGIIIGVLTGTVLVDYTYGNVCPSRICIDQSEVIPITDRGYFEVLYRELKNAKSSIHIVSFEVKYYENYANSSMNLIVQELIKAKERGVDVKIVVDEFSEKDNAHEILIKNGVEVKNDSKKTTTHSKLIVIDGETVILGSTNLSYYGLEKNHEANVLIRDEKVADYFYRYFLEQWESI